MNEIVLNQWLDEDNGNTGIFTTDIGADNRPLMEMIVDIEGYQTGSGDPSPENIRPIVSYGDGQVSVSGKNLFDINAISYISVGASSRYGVRFEKSGIYAISAQATGGYLYARTFNADGSTEKTYYIVSTDIRTNATFTIAEGESFIVYDAVDSGKTTAMNRFNNWKCQVEIGSSFTTYEPYTGTTYPITFPVSVYKGKLDLWSGVLMVTQVLLDLGLTEYEWKKGTYAFYLNIPNIQPNQYIICSCYKPNNPGTSGSNMPDFSVNNANGTYIYLKDSNLMQGTVDEMREALTGQTIAYPLATPTTYQLTQQQINTLLKDNVIYTTFGKIKRVTYPCDNKLYVEKNFLS